MFANKAVGLALVIVGVVANNAVYLNDLFLGKHEGYIFLGDWAIAGIIVSVLIAVAGLAILWRGATGDDGESGAAD